VTARRQSTPPDRFCFERDLIERGVRLIAGVDEAGRGPLAGPVVAAAVILSAEWVAHGLPVELSRTHDSKQLAAAERERLFELFATSPGVRFAVAMVEAAEIDALNILRATHRAMNEALARLDPPPDHVLVDGLPVKSLAFPQTAVVGGDARSFTIAAASIVAKVTRDRLMADYDRRYPDYGFGRHKGYGTPEHLTALARCGPCPIHRRSFAPLRLHQPELF
jgi:ribonuclease HII